MALWTSSGLWAAGRLYICYERNPDGAVGVPGSAMREFSVEWARQWTCEK
jgi:hypothetical protein